ncbi:FHA domain-containing protein, partial [Streptomyces niphimycinicus]|uniref:FHA domain-containing protein n=1 Tax=Streptomyces niphimycinicus TaxID=2842201 RepID=UPI003FD8C275
MPELVLELNGQTWTLDPSRSYSLGRDPQGDMVLDDARVSWRHATVRWGGRSWVIEDQGSTNGTYVQGRRIQQVEIGPGSAVHLGNATDGPRLSVSGGGASMGAAGAYGQQAAMGMPQQAQQPHQAQQLPAQQPQQQPGPGWPQQGVPQQGVPQQSGPQQGAPQPQGWPQPQQQPQAPHQQQPFIPQQQAPHQQPQHQQAPQPPHQQPQAPQNNLAQNGPGTGSSGPAGGAPAQGDRSPTTFHQLAAGRVMRIGRALENELVVSDLQVSRHHAEFRALP